MGNRTRELPVPVPQPNALERAHFVNYLHENDRTFYKNMVTWSEMRNYFVRNTAISCVANDSVYTKHNT